MNDESGGVGEWENGRVGSIETRITRVQCSFIRSDCVTSGSLNSFNGFHLRPCAVSSPGLFDFDLTGSRVYHGSTRINR